MRVILKMEEDLVIRESGLTFFGGVIVVVCMTNVEVLLLFFCD